MDRTEVHPSDQTLVVYLKGELARESDIDALEAHIRECNRCKVVCVALHAMIVQGRGVESPGESKVPG